jgi:hypothetical protein
MSCRFAADEPSVATSVQDTMSADLPRSSGVSSHLCLAAVVVALAMMLVALYLVRSVRTKDIYFTGAPGGKHPFLHGRISSDASWQARALREMRAAVGLEPAVPEDDLEDIARQDVPYLDDGHVARMLAGRAPYRMRILVGRRNAAENAILAHAASLNGPIHVFAVVTLVWKYPDDARDISEEFLFDESRALIATRIVDVSRRAMIIDAFVPGQVPHRERACRSEPQALE